MDEELQLLQTGTSSFFPFESNPNNNVGWLLGGMGIEMGVGWEWRYYKIFPFLY